MEQENYGAEQELEVTACPEEVTEEVTETVEIVEESAKEIIAEETAEGLETEEESAEQIEENDEQITEEISEEATEEPAEEPKKEKKTMKLWQMIVAGVAAGILLIALALLLLHGLGLEIVPKKNEDSGTPAYTAANDYTGTEKQAKKAADTVVATVGGKELTNKKLQVYYNIVVNDFFMNYYSYLSQIGLDLEKPLNEQKCYFEENESWEEYFVGAALETWVNYQSVALLAEEDGYQLDAESQKALDDLPAQMDEQAKSSGYANAEELLQAEMSCSVAEYVDYWTMYQIGYGYTSQEPAKADVEKYFEDHSKEYEESGITKDGAPIVDVRHILLQPKDGKTDENGVTTYTKDAWAACKKEAEKILKEWKAGDATESSFADLANEKSADGGSNTTGGLYSGITEDASYVPEFLAWCMDKKNEKGDTGIVKTEYGYHIMFMSKTEPYWFYAATSDYLSARTDEMIKEAKEKWPAETDYSKICIKEASLT